VHGCMSQGVQASNSEPAMPNLHLLPRLRSEPV
jgi:hypothetical protein